MKHKKKTKKKSNGLLFLIIIGILIYIAYGLCVSYVRAMEIQRSQQPPEAPISPVETMSVHEMIEYTAKQFGQSTKTISTIVCSESNYTVSSHDGGRAVNVTGIWDTTFDGWLPLYEKETGETLNKNSQFDSLKMMAWAFSKGDEYRYQWSTYHAYVNGGKAKIWSRYYNKYITVVIPNHCK